MSSESASTGPRVCGIADALQLVGDRWALLALRELGFGVTRFNDIQVNTGAPRASLTARLRSLEEAGLVERRRYRAHPPRDEYLLTQAGRDLGPALRELRLWGERYAGIDRSGSVFSSCGEADATESVVPDDEEES